MRKKYWVLWTYIANFSKLVEIEASSPTEAAEFVTGHFSKDFEAKATVYVFDHSPVYQRSPADVRSQADEARGT